MYFIVVKFALQSCEKLEPSSLFGALGSSGVVGFLTLRSTRMWEKSLTVFQDISKNKNKNENTN
jgi:hypothetical protein